MKKRKVNYQSVYVLRLDKFEKSRKSLTRVFIWKSSTPKPRLLVSLLFIFGIVFNLLDCKSPIFYSSLFSLRRFINRLCFLCLSPIHSFSCSLSTNRHLIKVPLETKIRKVNGLRRSQENQLLKSPIVRFKFSLFVTITFSILLYCHLYNVLAEFSTFFSWVSKEIRISFALQHSVIDLEWFSLSKIKTKVMSLSNHKLQRQPGESIKITSKLV